MLGKISLIFAVVLFSFSGLGAQKFECSYKNGKKFEVELTKLLIDRQSYGGFGHGTVIWHVEWPEGGSVPWHKLFECEKQNLEASVLCQSPRSATIREFSVDSMSFGNAEWFNERSHGRYLQVDKFLNLNESEVDDFFSQTNVSLCELRF